jgi:SAM-dependent methyltransferase
MHFTALTNADLFFKTYAMPGATVVDIGAQDVTGSLRQVCPYPYVGVDFVPGRGVDVVLDDPYILPFEADSQDIIVSSSCFEHSEMFWLLFLEILRVLKPGGLFYLNVPSNGDIHRHPVDCWRFYPDASGALVTWARRNGYNPVLLESFTSKRRWSPWNDYVAVFIKDASHAFRYTSRMTNGGFKEFTNGSMGQNATPWPQDQDSLLWRLRRLAYYIKEEPKPVSKAISVLRQLADGGRRSIWPNT